ncbi:hypothetical protein EN816_40285, partial [Mesorhizobium sp. M8A.F.Ca.ET.173.01.1.1]
GLIATYVNWQSNFIISIIISIIAFWLLWGTEEVEKEKIDRRPYKRFFIKIIKKHVSTCF